MPLLWSARSYRRVPRSRVLIAWRGVTIQSIVVSAGNFSTSVTPDGFWSLDLVKGGSATMTVTLGGRQARRRGRTRVRA